MQRCAICGKKVDLPFQCKYCGLYYCEEHRLPEQHECTNLPTREWKPKIFNQETKSSSPIIKKKNSTSHKNCPKCGSDRTMVTAVRKDYDLFSCLNCDYKWKINENFTKKHMPERQFRKFPIKTKISHSNKKRAILAILGIIIISGAYLFYLENPDFVQSILPNTTNSNNGLEINPKNLSLKYVLYGETNQISFTVFDGVNEYLSEIPRSISYLPWETAPTKEDFVMRFLNDEVQMDYLIELVDEIKSETSNKDDQGRIAISLVQQIPYDWSALTSVISENRYPYEVIFDEAGACEEKSRLLSFLLRELGFDSVLFNFESQNHMAVGIKCSSQYDFKDTGYCFVETTSPSIITYDQAEYVGTGKLTATPEIIHVSEGFSFESLSGEYNDAQELIRLTNLAAPTGYLNESDYNDWLALVNKYDIIISD